MAMQDQEQYLGRGSSLDIRATHSGVHRLSDRRDGVVLDFVEPRFRALRHLVALDRKDAEAVAHAAIDDPTNIQLVDFVEQIGLPEETIAEIKAKQDVLVPDERRPYFEKYDRAVSTISSIPGELSRARLNPFTEFENHPPILFGMGGGSQALCKGLPMDVLSMVLTAEKLRQELDLGKCRIICANAITYTNIPKNPDFSKEGIDRVLSAERDLLQMTVDRFGFGDYWDIFLETDVEKVIGPELKEQYDRMIEDADTVPFIGGHHYSMEMAQMWSLLNQELGGVKLGWFIRNLNVSAAGYIMDEQPFDARYVMYLASRGIRNTTSIPYAKAGVRLFPGATGQVDKDPPYICYDPSNRILLSPFEDPKTKLSEATQAGGGLRSKYVRRHFGTIVKLFEDLVLGKDLVATPVRSNGEIPRQGRNRILTARQQDVTEKPKELVYRTRQIDDIFLEEDERFSSPRPSRDSRVAERLQFILDFIFEGNRTEAERIWKGAFPTT